MNNADWKRCKKKDCNVFVLKGNLCERCKQISKEKKDFLLKATVGTMMAITPILLGRINHMINRNDDKEK